MNDPEVHDVFKQLIDDVDQDDFYAELMAGLAEDMDAELTEHLGAEAFEPIKWNSTGMEVSPADLYKMMAEASANQLNWFTLILTPQEMRELVVTVLPNTDTMPDGVFDSLNANLAQSEIWQGELDVEFCELIAAAALQSVGLPPQFAEFLQDRSTQAYAKIQLATRSANKFDGMSKEDAIRQVLEGLKDDYPKLYSQLRELDWSSEADLRRAIEMVYDQLEEDGWPDRGDGTK